MFYIIYWVSNWQYSNDGFVQSLWTTLSDKKKLKRILLISTHFSKLVLLKIALFKEFDNNCCFFLPPHLSSGTNELDTYISA